MANKRRRTIVIHSPHSGRSAQLAEALAHLQEAGIDIMQQLAISELDGLPAQGENWQRRGIELVIAAGGDGLIGGVITHIAASGLPMGILPLGTANDIARTLGIPLKLDLATKTISSGRSQEVDIGVAKPAQQAPHLASKGALSPVRSHVFKSKHGYFAHALTVGVNVQFARIATNVATRVRYGRFTYPIAAMETMKYHDALDVSMHLEGLVFPPGTQEIGYGSEDLRGLSYRALQITVINAPVFGGQWKFRVPNASISDRLLDIIVIEEIELGKLNAALARFFASRRPDHAASEINSLSKIHPAEQSGIPGIHHFQAKGVVITTNADPRDVTLDGEVRGQTPVYAQMAEERLRVVVPQDIVESAQR